MIKIFGIRHHGPGSTKRLQKALRQWQPDCLLVEAPADAEKSLLQMNIDGFQPPVALLLYNPKDFAQASYLPFANFSPEWQAVQYALSAGIPVKAMDLAMGIQLSLEAEQPLLIATPPADVELTSIRKDPLGYIAQIAGYQDSERWWEHTFEQEEDDLAVFTGINEMMKALRSELDDFERKETLLREAFMRKTLRKAIKEGYEKIAIVCGAWHAPALADLKQYKSSADNTLLRGLPKVNLKSCWIPWSYDRLAKQSGYGAGVISPAWYELIFGKRKETTIRWMSRVARLFRKKDLDNSPAHIIEAVRLAETLAAMRGLQIPGVEELEDAAVTVFCQGDPTPLQLIREQLIIGNSVGKIPPSLSTIPLQKDFEAQVKKARLTSAYQSGERVNKELDFRKATQKKASILLHRLSLLGIPWGTLGKLSGRELGSFKEKWKLKWRPDYAIRIIQASMYGNTVEEAASNWAIQEAQKIKDLAVLLDLLDQLQKADLPAQAKALVPLIQDMAAQTRDVLQLAAAVPSLVNILRYGSTRPSDKEAISTLLDAILPRIFIGLPAASIHLEEDPARDIFQQILNVHSSLNLLDSLNYKADWYACLLQLADAPNIHPLLQGIASRILFDTNYQSIQESTTRLNLSLSSGLEPAVKALWLEGFLHGSAMLIIYHPPLWQIIDSWIKSLAMEELYETLPLLRRTFSHFSHSERQELLKVAQDPSSLLKNQQETTYASDRMEVLMPALLEFLNPD